MDLPAEIKLDPEPKLVDENCQVKDINEINFGPTACKFTITDGAMMLRKYALPFLNKETKQAMLHIVDDNELVIHLRSGDAMTEQMNPNHLQPPCYFYTALINKGLPNG